MSRSITIRLPDDLHAAVMKACERRKIDLTTFMVQAAREAAPAWKTLGAAIKDGDVAITKITVADTPAAQAAAESFRGTIGPVAPSPARS